MSYLSYKMLKSEFNNDKALEIAAWCNETQSATWQDMGDYYECVEVEPTTSPKEVQIAKLDAQYQAAKTQLMQYYFEFSIAGDTEGMEAIKAELEALNKQYDNDLAELKGGE